MTMPMMTAMSTMSTTVEEKARNKLSTLSTQVVSFWLALVPLEMQCGMESTKSSAVVRALILATFFSLALTGQKNVELNPTIQPFEDLKGILLSCLAWNGWNFPRESPMDPTENIQLDRAQIPLAKIETFQNRKTENRENIQKHVSYGRNISIY